MRKYMLALILAPPLALLLGLGALRLEATGPADEPGPRDPTTAESPDPEEATPVAAGRAAGAWTTAVEPKPLGEEVRRGLAWLAEHQLPGGGWGQGEESVQMGSGAERQDVPSVGDTCTAALALIRSGSTPRSGPYRDAVLKAVGYVCAEVEAADVESMAVTSVHGTRLQQKLGPHIDTFLASMLLAEVKGRMPDAAGNEAVDRALARVLAKVERHQKEDGSFEGGGWAPVLAQAMCGKGINRARQAGAAVSDMALARAERGARQAYESTSRPATAEPAASGGRGTILAGPARGDAGIELYGRAASVGVLQDSVNTGQVVAEELRDKAENAPEEADRQAASRRLGEIDRVRGVQQQAQADVIARLDDPQFVAGFGSNGGEEFLSYMTISESLVIKGGEDWEQWDAAMAENLARVQNGDGSWSGHHCITGRTFCTAAALLVLMADRTPVPVATPADAPADAK